MPKGPRGALQAHEKKVPARIQPGPLTSFRMGTNPHRDKQVLSPDQKAARVKRLAKDREG